MRYLFDWLYLIAVKLGLCKSSIFGGDDGLDMRKFDIVTTQRGVVCRLKKGINDPWD